MAEGSNEESWWGWLQTAKEKVITQSSEVLEFVKNDIDEFTKVVSEEASSVVSSTASSLKTKLKLDDEESAANHVKKSMSGFLSHVAEVFTPPPDDGDEEAFVISNQQPVMLSRLEANVYSQVQDPDTFLKEPSNESDYNSWLETFELENKQVEMADLLVSCKPLHKHFSTLVPTQVSHTLFWHRYFYLVHRLQQQDEKRKQISSRATDAAAAATQDMVWEDDEALGGDVDIPEDVQTQLLQQYEEELMGSSEDGASQDEAVVVPDVPSVPDTVAKKGPKTQQPKSIRTDQTGSEKPVSSAGSKPAPTKAKSTPATTKSGTASQQMRTAAGQKKKAGPAKSGPVKAAPKATSKASSTASSTCSSPSSGKGRTSKPSHRGRAGLRQPLTAGVSLAEELSGSLHASSTDRDQLLGRPCGVPRGHGSCASLGQAASGTSPVVMLEDDIDVDLHDDLSNPESCSFEHDFDGSGRRSLCSSGDCNEDEWEKVDASDEDSGIASAKQSPVTDTSQDTPAATPSSTTTTTTDADKPKGEDWETWE